jgi:hypothetical protein
MNASGRSPARRKRWTGLGRLFATVAVCVGVTVPVPASSQRLTWQLVRASDASVVGQADLARGRLFVRATGFTAGEALQLELLDEQETVQLLHEFTARPGGAAVVTLDVSELDASRVATVHIRGGTSRQPGAVVVTGRLRGRLATP